MTASGRSPFEARTEDGLVLRGDVIGPAAPRAIAITLHAMMVNRRTIDRPANGGLCSVLAESGITVVNVDFRGHGTSDSAPGERPDHSYDDFVLLDVPAIIAAIRRKWPGVPIAVVGHSLGGHVSLITSGLLPDRAPDALVMLAANLWLPRTEPNAALRAKKAAFLTAFSAVANTFGQFNSKLFRVGTDTESAVYADQFVRFWRNNALASRDGSVDYEAALARARLHVYSIASEGDKLLANPASVQGFTNLASNARVTHRVVAHGELGSRAPSHMELVTSSASKPLWLDIARYLHSTLRPKNTE
ncbi:MAG: alpha/beta fold hydrolase [Polyangiaceae bacterium]|nr:alpha/beta fold hydrolase [Polyangiaceae bacterium]